MPLLIVLFPEFVKNKGGESKNRKERKRNPRVAKERTDATDKGKYVKDKK